MDSRGQLVCFLLSLAVGFVGGLAYEAVYILRFLFSCDKGKWKGMGVVIDIFGCLCFAFWCMLASFCLQFPDFRGYICLAWVLGCIIYLKILHRILAFLIKVCYNVLVRMLNKAKNKIKTLKEERKDI